MEKHWNGALLSSVKEALEWSGTMTWKGIQPVIHFLDKKYKTGKKLKKKEMREDEERILRSKNLPRWDVVIAPTVG